MNKTIIIVIVIVSSLILLTFLFLIIKKTIQLNSFKKKQTKLQLPEIIDQKFFITSNQEKLKLFQNHDFKKKEPIFCFVHDIMYFPKVFIKQSQNLAWNIFYYAQSGFKNDNPNLKSFATNIINLIDLTNALKQKYQSKIYIIALGCSWIWVLKTNLKNIVILNPIWNWNKFNFSKLIKLNFRFAIFKNLNSVYELKVFKNFNATNSQSKKINFNFCYYFQLYKSLHKKQIVFNYLKKNKLLILQDENNFFHSLKTNNILKNNPNLKLISKIDLKIDNNLINLIITNLNES